MASAKYSSDSRIYERGLDRPYVGHFEVHARQRAVRLAQHFLAERKGAVDVLHAELGVLRQREHAHGEDDPGQVEGGGGAVEAEDVVDVRDHAQRILSRVELHAERAEVERVVGVCDRH